MLPDLNGGLGRGGAVDLSQLGPSMPTPPFEVVVYSQCAMGVCGVDGLPQNISIESNDPDVQLGIVFGVTFDADGHQRARYYLVDNNSRKNLINGLVGQLTPDERAELCASLAAEIPNDKTAEPRPVE